MVQPGPAFAAIARGLDAAEGRFRQRCLKRVDRQVAAFDALDHAVDIGGIVGEAVGGKAVRNRARAFDRLVQRSTGLMTASGPKGSSCMTRAVSGTLASTVGWKK